MGAKKNERLISMRGLGTIINVACIVLGGTAGYLAGNRLKENIRETLLSITGVSIAVLGLGGTLAQMLTVSGGQLETHGTMMMILSLAIGTVIGEAVQVEEKIALLGAWLKETSHSTGDNSFVNGFVTASCTVCIGAMAVIGSIQDGISGDYSTLAAKGILDAIIVCVMAASMGKGCIFSAVPVGVFQGLITLLAFWAGDFLPAASLDNLSLVGNILILCVGLNLIRTRQIRTANVLPAIVIAALWGFF